MIDPPPPTSIPSFLLWFVFGLVLAAHFDPAAVNEATILLLVVILRGKL